MNLKKIRQTWTGIRKETGLIWKSLAKVNSMVYSTDRWLIIWNWFGSIWSGMITLGVFTAFGQIYSRGMATFTTHGHITLQIVVISVISVSLYMMAQTMTGAVRSWRESTFHEQIDNTLDLLFIKHLATLDLGRISSSDFEATKDNAESKGYDTVHRMWSSERELISSVVGLIASLVVMSTLDPLLIVFCFIPFIPIVTKSYRSDMARRQLWEEQRLLRRQRNEYRRRLDTRWPMIHSRLLNMTKSMFAGYEDASTELRNANKALERRDAIAEVRNGAIEIFALCTAIAYIGWKLARHQTGSAELFVLLGAVRTSANSLQGAAHSIMRLFKEHLNFQYLEKFFDTKPLIDESTARDLILAQTPVISFTNVTFQYPGTTSPAVSSCTLRIDPGERIAIIGRNGDGKTTLARLIAKVYLPTEGNVQIDSIPTSDISQKSWIEHFVYSWQNTVVGNFEIDFAITGERVRSKIDYNLLYRAAEITKAREFIEKKPQGFATQIGDTWPGGVELSTGEMQRLSLTAVVYRFLKQGLFVGIFDEPMANCDVETRSSFYRGICEIEGKTVIVILHDPLFLDHFDRIILMEQGRIRKDLRGKDQIRAYQQTIVEYLQMETKEEREPAD